MAISGRGKFPLNSPWLCARKNSIALKFSALYNQGARGSIAPENHATIFLDWFFGVLNSYTITAESGSFLVTGTAASLKYGRTLQAASGSFLVSGTAASLLATRKITADSGSFLITGTDANLIYSSGPLVEERRSAMFMCRNVRRRRRGRA